MRKEIIIFGFVAGVALRSFVNFGVYFAFIFALTSIFLFISEYFYRNYLNKEVDLKNFAVILLFLSFGMIWYDIADNPVNNYFEENVGKSISLKGIIVEEPEERGVSTNLIVSFSGENILVKTGNFPKYKYGDEIEIYGQIKKPENFYSNFDYASYLGKDDINYIIDKPKIIFISSGNGNFLKEKLFEIKSVFMESIRNAFSEPESSLLSGLIIGAKESLGKDWLDKFRTVGLSHTIVLSGYNLTIIADATMKIFSGIFSMSTSILLGSFSIVLFAIMTGGGASTIRATIMSLIILLARATGRMYEAGSALILAGFFMIFYNPKVLVFDLSFQLSFLATLGLIYLSPVLKEKLKFLPDKFRELVATTLGAQLATAPLIAYKMGTFSIISLPANLLVVVFIPATMFFGFLATIINLFSFYLALPFIFVTWLLLSYELFIVDIFSSIPFASIDVNFRIVSFTIFLFFATLFFIKYLKRTNNFYVIQGENWEVEEIK